MRTRTKLTAGAAFALALLFGAAAPAVAAPAAPTTKADVVNIGVVSSGTTARIAARYTCTGSPEQIHLWVSVKQSANRRIDRTLSDEGSGYGGIAAAWSQSHAGTPVCDGKAHVSTFVVDQTEAGYGTLKRGFAYVQFCLFDATTGDEVPVSSMEWAFLL